MEPDDEGGLFAEDVLEQRVKVSSAKRKHHTLLAPEPERTRRWANAATQSQEYAVEAAPHVPTLFVQISSGAVWKAMGSVILSRMVECAVRVLGAQHQEAALRTARPGPYKSKSCTNIFGLRPSDVPRDFI